MSFDQGELHFSGNDSEEGHRKWQRELQENKRAFEARFGVILGRRVRVQLTGELEPLEGIIYLISQKSPQPATPVQLCLGNRKFTPRDIDSIVSVDAAADT